jgi:hypothetical protein
VKIGGPQRWVTCIRHARLMPCKLPNVVARSSATAPAPEGGQMAMMLFTLLNGLAVVFLVYVLVQFWKEGHRSEQPDARDRVIEFAVERKPTVVVVTRPISAELQVADAPKPELWRRRVEPAPVSLSAHSGLSVVSNRAPLTRLQSGPIQRNAAGGTAEMPVKRYSSR